MKYISGEDNIGEYKIVTDKGKEVKCGDCSYEFNSGEKFYFIMTIPEDDEEEQETSIYCKNCYKTHRTAEEL